MQMLPRTQPRNLDDITVQVALVRPGPIQGGAIHPYIERRKALREDPAFQVPYPHPLLEPVLEETLGTIASTAHEDYPTSPDCKPSTLGTSPLWLSWLERRPFKPCGAGSNPAGGMVPRAGRAPGPRSRSPLKGSQRPGAEVPQPDDVAR
jgi:hypothetical protein